MEPTAPAQPRSLRNYFVNRETGALARITGVDDTYAYQEILAPKAGPRYSMPLSEYDHTFVRFWRPATTDDLVAEDTASFRLPANAPEDWRTG